MTRETHKRTLIAVIGMCLSCTAHADDARLDAAIAQHRMGTLTVRAEPNANVRIEQLRHEFWFGAALSNGPFSKGADPETAATYRRVFLENFNAAVTENALKWHGMERRPGHVDYSTVDAILDWTAEHEIPLRGHCVFWGVPSRVPNWQKQLDDDRLRSAIQNRAMTVAQRYRGRFAEYDLNNEMMHANYYEARLGPEITRQMADWFKQGDPDAVLYVNDYDVLTGNRLDDYVAHIRRLLDRGVPLGGIGVQGHLHADGFDPAVLQRSLEKLAKLGLPICVTEFNMPGQRSRFYRGRGQQLTAAEQQAKAEAIVDYYRICFAQPAVKGILMWGFWEGANWIPVSSLYRRDWTPTPAAHAYRDLVYRQWWTNWEGKADSNGNCQIRAFYGKYQITTDGKKRVVDLKS